MRRRGAVLRVARGRAIGADRSRSAAPAQTSLVATDTRRLGVGVAGIVLDGRRIGLADRRLEAGWHRPEAGLRWTDGDATLDVRGAAHLDLTLVATGLRYWTGGAARRHAA